MAEYQKTDHIFKELIVKGEDKTCVSIMRTPGKSWIKLVKMWTNEVQGRWRSEKLLPTKNF